MIRGQMVRKTFIGLFLVLMPFVLFAQNKTKIKIPEGMVLIPAGEFWMGSDEKDIETACVEGKKGWYPCEATWFVGEKPKHRVYLDAFAIDKYPVTNMQYEECVVSGKCKKPQFTIWYDNETYANYPVVYVNWNQANVYCKWAEKRLPREAEWEKAARGENGNIYLWGNTWDENKCNTFSYKLSLHVQVASMEQIMHKISNPNRGTTPVGSFKDCVSSYGVYDMAGNVWEWVYDWYDENYYKNSPKKNPKGPIDGYTKVIRGGSWGYGNASHVFFRTVVRLRNSPPVQHRQPWLPMRKRCRLILREWLFVPYFLDICMV